MTAGGTHSSISLLATWAALGTRGNNEPIHGSRQRAHHDIPSRYTRVLKKTFYTLGQPVCGQKDGIDHACRVQICLVWWQREYVVSDSRVRSRTLFFGT